MNTRQQSKDHDALPLLSSPRLHVLDDLRQRIHKVRRTTRRTQRSVDRAAGRSERHTYAWGVAMSARSTREKKKRRVSGVDRFVFMFSVFLFAVSWAAVVRLPSCPCRFIADDVLAAKSFDGRILGGTKNVERGALGYTSTDRPSVLITSKYPRNSMRLAGRPWVRLA